MHTNNIRSAFLNYYQGIGHTIVPSSSLVPLDDPSLLFTSAGMVQFKKVFLGQERREYLRATSCQRCLRAGGKHNDLENVGFTSRHHTFFEMLGNFSFGDYFKQEAIQYAWDFITKHLKLPPEKLWITVYEQDLESELIWLNQIKIDPHRFSRCDANENFWSMGDIGPCGPCTEIYYDHGTVFPGEPPGYGDPQERYVEIYNLVFMQYNRTIDGVLEPLPKPCVDTGMGLERVAAIMQGVHSNYKIDIFVKLIKDLGELLQWKDLEHNSLKVIADHLRASSFLIMDGVFPSNEGRGYVLRRILRRAIRHGYKLGRKEPFLHLAVSSLINIMGMDLNNLKEQQFKIAETILSEELQFAKTLDHGMKLLSNEIAIINEQPQKLMPGELIFKLYDTYGFPVDLTIDLAKEHHIAPDLAGFEQCMLAQRERARNEMKFKAVATAEQGQLVDSIFVGYEQNIITTNIENIFTEVTNQATDHFIAGAKGRIMLTATPFYGESGGQIGDTGVLSNEHGKFIVTDTQKIGNTIIHLGYMEQGIFKVGEAVTASIDLARRNNIKANHSATHLLHATLKKILGAHVKQQGSLVTEQRLRFDFEHGKALTQEQILAIEEEVNFHIRMNHPTIIKTMNLADAMAQGAVALFGDKYQEQVRVLNIADNFSIELCGGTHVARTGEIGCFKILSESAVAAGVRRIEAITGSELVKVNYANQQMIEHIMRICKIQDPNLIPSTINGLLAKNKELTKQLDHQYKQHVLHLLDQLTAQTMVLQDCKVLISKVEFDPNYLKFAVERLIDQFEGIIVLGGNHQGKVKIIVSVAKNLLNKFTDQDPTFKEQLSAIALIKGILPIIDGKGGGRVELAEAMGNNVNNIVAALAWIKQRIQQYFNKF